MSVTQNGHGLVHWRHKGARQSGKRIQFAFKAAALIAARAASCKMIAPGRRKSAFINDGPNHLIPAQMILLFHLVAAFH